MTTLRLSWVESANTGLTDFPLQNLPYGVFSTAERSTRAGVAIGDRIVDLQELAAAGLLPEAMRKVFAASTLNPFISLGQSAWRDVRQRLTEWLALDADAYTAAALRERALVPMAQARLHLPLEVTGYTDFYSSRHHAENCGRLFREPEHALPPNWLELPIGYNGRASTIVASGTPVSRPSGQRRQPGEPRPVFGPSGKLDFELEMAFVIGKPSAMSEPIPIAQAPDHLFGMVLLNDWSARDFQQWESAPLGPFNSKSFCTSISPWIVTMDALEAFRCAHPVQQPAPLDYLRQDGEGAYAIELEASIRPAGGKVRVPVTHTNFRSMYWTVAQQLAHHTVSGCNVRVGDLMGSGTLSGATPDSLGCLLEITKNGKEALTLPDGSTRHFLLDGDEVSIRGWCQGNGYRVGFGEVSGEARQGKDFAE
ncbi:fumarylacetoacetase [Cupriavidus pauculus]|uniref:fumarylacetoacetase n=1 Tax=Cupriavidus pauculus TaxID=82633 RepID=UPI001EE37B2D|nr:fumarylacetoacetase [Cupriavidus pauculus]GJG98508.1 fumarylacetoacetase [Cupriavidus pauculus]